MKKKLLGILLCALLLALTLSACKKDTGAAAAGPVTIEFAQWWELELPAGSLRGIMDKFEAKNPNIKVKLLTAPFASTYEQLVVGAASGTMSDVMGLGGPWVNDFVKRGAIANLSTLMKNAGYDEKQLASEIKLNGSTYMIPTVTFIYPLFINETLYNATGIADHPRNRTEFITAAKALTKGNTHGWIIPLSLEAPNGIQNDLMCWLWASGKSMLKDGKPDLTNSDVKATVQFAKTLFDAKAAAPGANAMKEQDKVVEFSNARVGMMVSSLAHITTIRKNNPDLKFTITAVPPADGYTGKGGVLGNSWGIGIAENSKHKAEAWKLIEFLMSEEINAELSSLANAFPGNTKSVPDFINTDELFRIAFDIYQNGYLVNEFVGLPVALELMRLFDEQFQLMLEGGQSVDEMLVKAQSAWEKKF